VDPGKFQFAGNKDRRAITVQRISVPNVEPIRLLSLNEKFWTPNMRISSPKIIENQLQLGALFGNHFQIAIRNVENLSAEEIDESFQALSDNGFINYFGMQRFGCTNVPTHVIGEALIKSDWETAVNLILSPKNIDDDATMNARKIWFEEKDAVKAAKAFPMRNTSEKRILFHLAKDNCSSDFAGAIAAIPREMRMMYLHSYQSFIWNHAVSHRIEKFGMKVLEGDIVPNPLNKSEPIIVTNENIEKYSIFDIALPLPGSSVIYPENETKKIYEEILLNHGKDFSSLSNKNKLIDLSGDYRKIVVKPLNMAWKQLSYSSNDEQLMLSDFEKLEGKELELKDGPLKGIVVEFSLPSSSYATMALREAMRMETSSSHQRNLSKRIKLESEIVNE
ncbi:pseudouridine synthase, partial [Rozella allomycis CSF55]